jgi:nitroalkane oxidase
MQVAGVDSYAHEQPLGRLLQDALALPLFGGSNLGLRRRQLHAMLREPGYDADATLSGDHTAARPRTTP